jgi:hypothetical protein
MPIGPAFKNKTVSGPSAPSFQSDGSDLVFARFVALIRASTEMHGCTVLAWDNPAVDATPPADEGPPWCRLTPTPGNAVPFCVDPEAGGLVHEMPMEVRVETSTPGGDVLQSQRFWGSILRAIFPGGMLDEQLQMLGVSWVKVLKPAWGPPPFVEGKPSPRCEGVGGFELVLYFATPE